MLSDDVPDPEGDMRRIARGIAMTIVAASMAIDAAGLASPFSRTTRPLVEASASSALDVDGDRLVWREPPVFPHPAPYLVPQPELRPEPVEPAPPVFGPVEMPLHSADIETMSSQHASSIANCWRRARKGAEDLVLQDVRKVTVVLTIDRSGAVTNAGYKGLPPGTKLETCLTTMLKSSWKFRTNPGATLGFTMVPPS